MSTETKELTVKERKKTMLEMWGKQKDKLDRALPSHMDAGKFLQVLTVEFERNPDLWQCTQMSVYGAMMTLGQLGLEADSIRGHAYLIPFKNRKKGIVECQLIPGYKGYIELARRSGQLLDIYAECVYEDDEFDIELGTDRHLTHKPNYDGDRIDDKIKGCYAVAKLRDGTTPFVYVPHKEIESYRARSSAPNSPAWTRDYAAMCKKTAVRRLATWLPLSAEMQSAVALDEQAEAGNSQWMDIQPAGEGETIPDPVDELADKLEAEESDTPAEEEPDLQETSSNPDADEAQALMGQIEMAVAEQGMPADVFDALVGDFGPDGNKPLPEWGSANLGELLKAVQDWDAPKKGKKSGKREPA